MPSRIIGIEENERALELADFFRDDFLALVDEVNTACGVEDCTAEIGDCYRSFTDQLTVWRKGRRFHDGKWIETGEGVVTRAEPGKSPHQYRLAGHVVLKDPETGAWLNGGRAADSRWNRLLGLPAERRGFVWGGRFRGFFDGAHVEHPKWRGVAERYGWRGLPADLDPAGVVI